MSEIKNLELRSAEIRKILDKKPSRLLRWGTVFIMMAIMAILITAWFIKYPDIVNTEVVISDSTPPVPVTTRTQGLLADIFVEEGQLVEKGMPLATMKSAVDFEDTQELEKTLEMFQPYNASTFFLLDSINLNDYGGLQLGEIEPSLIFLINAVKEYKIGFQSDDQAVKMKTINSRINSLKRLIAADEKKIPLLEEKKRIYIQVMKREQDRMLNDTTMTSADLEKHISNKIDVEQDIINYKAAIEAKKLEVSDLQSQIILARQENSTGNSLAFEDIDEKTKYLKTQIDKWKEKYLLIAPEPGIISFYENKLDGKKFFQASDKVMAILPETTNELIGKVSLDVRHNGKVAKGQDVLIKLSSYPYQEFGKLRGKIRYKAEIPNDNLVAVEIELVNGLVTTNGKMIPQDQQLIGMAEIITEKKRLFQRIYENLF